MTRYETFEELLDYCQLVGRAGRRARAARVRRRHARADRAVRQDLRRPCRSSSTSRTSTRTMRRGRVYMPSEDLVRFGCSETSCRRRCAVRRGARWSRSRPGEHGRSLADGAPLARTLPGSPADRGRRVRGGWPHGTARPRSGQDARPERVQPPARIRIGAPAGGGGPMTVPAIEVEHAYRTASRSRGARRRTSTTASACSRGPSGRR